MSIKHIFAATLCAASISASGAGLPIHFGSGETSGSNAQDYLPVHLGYTHSGSQSLYTAAELDGLRTVDGSGKVTTGLIGSVTFLLNPDDAMWSLYGEHNATVKVSVQNISDTQFVKDGNTYKWFRPDETSSGSFVIDGTSVDWGDAAWGVPCSVEVTVTLDTPLEYAGESLLFTWSCDDSDFSDEYACTMSGNFGFKPGTDVRTLTAYDTGKTFASFVDGGTYKAANTYLPPLQLEYEPVEVAGGTTVERGDPAQLTIGQWTSRTATSNQSLPFDFDFAQSGSQTIYSPAMLADLNADPSLSYVEISGFSFPVSFSNTPYDYYSELVYDGWEGVKFTVYASTVEQTHYVPDASGRYSWLPYADGVVGHGALSNQAENFDMAFEDNTEAMYITVTFDEPVKYVPGQNLMLTWECASEIPDGSYQGDRYATNPGDGFKHSLHTGFTKSISVAQASKTTTDMVSAEYPSIRINYVPCKESGSSKTPVTITNLSLSVDQVAVDPAVQAKFGGMTQLNRISLDFDINDESGAEGQVYEIVLDNVSLGSVTSKSATIGYLGHAPRQDMLLAVRPSDPSTIGTSVKLPAADFDALFPAPEASMTKARFFLDTDNADGVDIPVHLAVQFDMGTDGFAARVQPKATSHTYSSKLITADGDFDVDVDGFRPVENWSNLHLNDHKVSYFYTGIHTARYEGADIILPTEDVTVSLDFAIYYPVVTSAAHPVLIGDGPRKALAEGVTIDSATAYKSAEKSVKPSNSGYSGVSFAISPADGGLSGVEDIVSEDTAGTEYFNLQGMRVNGELAPGIYIRRAGQSVTKVVVR